MYGNTHLVADAIGRGLARSSEVTVVSVDDADLALVADADLVVVGGPTHVHGVSRASTRKAAIEQASELDSGDEVLDADAGGAGLRDWFETLAAVDTDSAAFDTRTEAPALLTGRASTGIAKRLRHHGFRVVTEPESFLVTKDNHLVRDEEARAEEWGAQLAEATT